MRERSYSPWLGLVRLVRADRYYKITRGVDIVKFGVQHSGCPAFGRSVFRHFYNIQHSGGWHSGSRHLGSRHLGSQHSGSRHSGGRQFAVVPNFLAGFCKHTHQQLRRNIFSHFISTTCFSPELVLFRCSLQLSFEYLCVFLAPS
jgi:hypothetical protein